MLTTTIIALEAILKADHTVSLLERKKILALARGENVAFARTKNEPNCPAPPRIYSRSQAAELLGGKTTRYVDLLCRRGLLKKFLPIARPWS